MPDGILIIDKPAGITSHDAVMRVRRILKTKRAGHTGTLDPFATGVMVVMVGKATRLARFLDKDAKEYEAMVRFGFETETGDRTGELRITNYELRDISPEQVEKVLPDFRGEIWQTPPMYSAKKVEGKKLYELARQGIEIERKAVKITIYELEIIEPGVKNQKPKTQDLALRVVCSAGTYIRTLAEDIGKKLGVGAHLAELRRTRAGKFDLSQAVTLEELELIVSENRLDEVLISMNETVSHLAEIKLTETEMNRVKNGMQIDARKQPYGVQPIRLTDGRENLVAIGFYDETEQIIRPQMVFSN